MALNLLLLIIALTFFLAGYHLSKHPDYDLLIDDASFLSLIYRLLPQAFYILSVLFLSFILVDFFIPHFKYFYRLYMMRILATLFIFGALYAAIEHMIHKRKKH